VRGVEGQSEEEGLGRLGVNGCEKATGGLSS